MNRVGVLDLGTNTFRILIASRTDHQKIKRERIERRIVRIGEGFVKKGEISEVPAGRAREILKEFTSLLQRSGVTRVMAVATGVFREAGNAAGILEDLSSLYKLPIRIITGAEEGNYTLQGIKSGMGLPEDQEGLIVDIGGGSTEFVRVDRAGDVRIQSLPIGVVYLKERFETSVLSDTEAFYKMEQSIDTALEDAILGIESSDLPDCIGTGGTITTLSYMNLGLEAYEPSRIHGSFLTLAKVERLLAAARECTAARLQQRFNLEKGRADLVLYGAALVKRILTKLPGGALSVSDYGLLEGVAEEMFER
jgi:exopolyphosphatase/guanosine-5'-triphosphate,3'-diphosphate pyrophosphatase